MEHTCDELKACVGDKNYGAYGHAIYSIFKNEEGWWASNTEYSTRINYCPFCGKKLEER